MDTSQSPARFATTIQRIVEVGYGNLVRYINTKYVAPQKHTMWDEIVRIRQILRATSNERVVLLSSTSGKIHPDIMAAILMRLRPAHRRPTVALLGSMWDLNKGFAGKIERFMISQLDPIIARYIVQSTEELDEFPRTWNVDRAKMRLCPYFYSVEDGLVLDPPPPQERFIFAGGNSKRNYEPIIEAARRFPDEQFVIATHLLDDRTDLPSNVRVGQVSHSEFMRLMQSARIVITPLKSGMRRAAGQQTYLNAMLMRKPIIVNEVFGVRDHIRDGVDGLVVDGSTESYERALRWMLADENAEALDTMAASGYQRASQDFTMKRHVERLLGIMDELVDEVERSAQPVNKTKPLEQT